MKDNRNFRRKVSVGEDVDKVEAADQASEAENAPAPAAENDAKVPDDASTAETGKGESDAASSDSFGDVPPIDGEDGSGSYYKPASVGPGELEPDELEAMQDLIDLDSEFASLPHPEIFNAYPVEVQRKIIEWTDRDVKARRDDESRRQDELMRAKVERDRRKQSIPAIIAVLAIIAGAVVGIVTANPMFSVVFVAIALAVVIGRIATEFRPASKDTRPKLPPK